MRSAHHDTVFEAGDSLLTVERVAHQDPPEPDAALRPWLDGDWDDPGTPPRLCDAIGEEPQRVTIVGAPEI